MVRSVRGDVPSFISTPARHVLRLVLAGLLIITLTAPTAPKATLAQTSGPAVTLTKTLLSPASGQASVDDPVTFQISLANTGSTTIDVLPLGDTFDPAYLRFASATVNGVAAAPSFQSTNVISWTDLTLLPQVGDLAPGSSATIVTTFTALAVTKANGGLSPATLSGPPGTALPGTTLPVTNPGDFYEKESRFVIDHAIDQTNGGIYLAVQGNGTVWGAIPDVLYGFPANFFQGSTKHPGGQAVCMEYFMREYQRLSATGATVATQNHGIQQARDMLGWAKNCADFVNAHMIIGKGQNEPPRPECVPGDGNTCLYYWGFVDAAGTSGQRLATGKVAGFSSPNSYHIMDSFIAWMMAQLARTLKQAGDPSYITYKQAAYDFYNWTQLVGPPYNPQNPTGADPSYAGRDQHMAGLMMTLYELSVDEGTPDPTLRANTIACVNQTGIYGTTRNQRGRCSGKSYTTAYGRAAANAIEVQHQGVDNYAPNHEIWHDFGSARYEDDPATPNNPTVPFAHGAGRELVAGLQRDHWFYYTFPDNPEPADLVKHITVPGNWTIESWSQNAILGYWDYSIKHMWDATAGQEAWWDAELAPAYGAYKPCFSLGTPIPVADWKAPDIGNKVHTINADGSATVTISGVTDPDWDYLSWKFKGIGVKGVRIFYSINDGANWTQVAASPTATPGTYTATIPPQPGQTVLYYAEAEDAFGNISTFPAHAPQVYQLYTLQDKTYNLAWSLGSSDNASLGIIEKRPAAITLSRLEAQRQTGGVNIAWQTASEDATFGFNIYRGTTFDRTGAVRLNTSLVPSKGAGTTYQFLDRAPLDGPAVYWLEEVDLNGRSSWYSVPYALTPSGSLRVLLPVVRR